MLALPPLAHVKTGTNVKLAWNTNEIEQGLGRPLCGGSAVEYLNRTGEAGVMYPEFSGVRLFTSGIDAPERGPRCPEQTICHWRNPELIDTGQKPGLSSIKSAKLAAARRRIAELETELAIAKRSTELLKSVVLPKDGSKRSK